MKDIKTLKLNPQHNPYKNVKKNIEKGVNEAQAPEKTTMDWHYRDEEGKIQHVTVDKGDYGKYVDPSRDLVPEIISKKLYKRIEDGREYYGKRYPDDIYCSTENLYVYVPPIHMYGPNYPLDKTPYLAVGYVLIDEETYKSGKVAVLRAVSPITKKQPINTDEYMILNLETGKYILYDAFSMIDLATDTREGSFKYVCVKDLETVLGYKMSFFERPSAPDSVLKINEVGHQMEIDRKWRVYNQDKINEEKLKSTKR